jgi:hypothetical protein
MNSVDKPFWYWKEKGINVSLGVESYRLEACVQEALLTSIPGLHGCPGLGFNEDNLNFLTQLPHLEKIWFYDVDLIDVDAVYSLEKIRSFGIHPKRPAIDFSRIKSLRSLVWVYKKQDRGVQDLCNLEEFYLWHFSPKEKTFDALNLPGKLVNMQINWANPSSLSGLRENPNLKRLEFCRCRNLEDVSSIPALFPKLERLEISASGRVQVEACRDMIKSMPNLKFAIVQDKVLVE